MGEINKKFKILSKMNEIESGKIRLLFDCAQKGYLSENHIKEYLDRLSES